MYLDRNLQLQLLKQLAAAYPEFDDVCSQRIMGDPVTVNLWYLEEHGLVENIKAEFIGAPPTVSASKITHKGLDFIADDGGLSAILNTVTVKLHNDTLRDLLISKINSADLPEAEKKSLVDHIKELPGEALSEATTRLTGLALDRLPDAIQWLQKWLETLN